MKGITELRRMRTEQPIERDVDRVLGLARPLILSNGISRAGDEAWDIYEQTLIAALEAADDTLAVTCLTRLRDKFPQSGRVHALRGMLLESTQDPKEALKFYNEVLAIDPTNVRQITFEKSLGRVGEAIAHLVDYLNIYYTDGEAWAELGELYTSLGLFDRAAFSWTEALLLKPHDHAMHASFAETLFAQWLQTSDSSFLHSSLKSYLRSLELNDDNLRSFCGIKMCCDKILDTDLPKNKTHASTTNGTEDPVDQDKVRSLRLVSLRWLLQAQHRKELHCSDSNILSLLKRLTASHSAVVY